MTSEYITQNGMIKVINQSDLLLAFKLKMILSFNIKIFNKYFNIKR